METPERDESLRVIASIHRDGISLDVKPVDLCFLIALHARASQNNLTCFEEDVLLDVFEQVCEAVDSNGEPLRKRATHAIQRLREQRLLSRVDGAGIVRAGDYSMTRLASSIVEFFMADQALTRESLSLLTKALLVSLAQVKSEAKKAQTADHWRVSVVGPLRVTVGTSAKPLRSSQDVDTALAEVESALEGAVERRRHAEHQIDALQHTLDKGQELVRELDRTLAAWRGANGRALPLEQRWNVSLRTRDALNGFRATLSGAIGDPSARLEEARNQQAQTKELQSKHRVSMDAAQHEINILSPRHKALCDLIQIAWSLDEPDQAAKLEQLLESLAGAKAAAAEIQRVARDRVVLEQRLDTLRTVPLLDADIESLRREQKDLERRLDETQLAIRSIEHLQEHRAALDWTDAQAALDKQVGLVPALEAQLKQAKAQLDTALQTARGEESRWSAAVEAFNNADADLIVKQKTIEQDEEQFRRLQDIERARAAKGLPSRLNRRTATALVGPHSKASLSAPRREALANLNIMHDGTLRLRTPDGLRLRVGDRELDCATITRVMGEVILTERALADGTVLTGQSPQAILLVENLGAYLDLPAPPGWLLAHVPGWDTRTVRLLLQQVRDVPVAHFGDLDPNGVRIMRHLREVRPDLRWVVPEFWSEYVPKVGLRAEWPQDLDLGDVPPLVRQLASSGMWLEQEAIVLDPRLPREFAAPA